MIKIVIFDFDGTLADTFDLIFAITNRLSVEFGYKKAKAEEIVYIGDEIRDINAAKKAKVKVIAVTWGFNSKEVLSEYQPDALVDQPQELIEVINNF